MESTEYNAKDIQGVPQGYTLCQDDEGSSFAVPQFLVPAGHTSFDAFRRKSILENNIIPKVFIINSYFLYIVLIIFC